LVRACAILVYTVERSRRCSLTECPGTEYREGSSSELASIPNPIGQGISNSDRGNHDPASRGNRYFRDVNRSNGYVYSRCNPGISASFLPKNTTEGNGPSPTALIRQRSYNKGTNATSSTLNCHDSTWSALGACSERRTNGNDFFPRGGTCNSKRKHGRSKLLWYPRLSGGVRRRSDIWGTYLHRYQTHSHQLRQ
jgi:hypothetical protein